MKQLLLFMLAFPFLSRAQKFNNNYLTIFDSDDTIRNITVISPVGQVVYNHDYSSVKVFVNIPNMSPGFYTVKINQSDHRNYYCKDVFQFSVVYKRGK